jgi:hypothetical protein
MTGRDFLDVAAYSVSAAPFQRSFVAPNSLFCNTLTSKSFCLQEFRANSFYPHENKESQGGGEGYPSTSMVSFWESYRLSLDHRRDRHGQRNQNPQ